LGEKESLRPERKCFVDMWHEGIGRCGGCHPGAIIALVILVVIVALAIWGIVALLRHGRSRPADRGNGAMAIVRERYARGEINKEEFDRIKKDLS
jgi:putative membrane protein